ncbi:MAG TPA: periplasmic heavy metal sensor [Thermoanaerobaculia bacterium]|nr:periplasmic heavy metal sensor [Thermoanaerobaculia bacterium]
MKKRLIIITILTTIAAAALYAGPGRHMRGGHGFGGGFFAHLHEVADELDLTDAQKTQIHAIFKETREENREYWQQMHGGIHSVARTLIANPNDIAGAQAVLDQQIATERALKTNMLRAASKALNVLTPAQRTELAELAAKRAAERENRRNRK